MGLRRNPFNLKSKPKPMLKFSSFIVAVFSAGFFFAQLVSTTPDGRYTLTAEGASYFAKLSLE